LSIFVIFKKLAKEKNRPIGENSPNLVTLVWTQFLSFFSGKSNETTFLVPFSGSKKISLLQIEKPTLKTNPTTWLLFS
jgi:hypothetical protein